MSSIAELDADVAAVRTALRSAGVANKTLNSIQTKALRTPRKVTGEWKTNREYRWDLVRHHPQYATHKNCLIIHLRLLGMMCEFVNAPDLPQATRKLLAKYIGHHPNPGTYRDALTLRLLNYNSFADEVLSGSHGESGFHVGHEDPTRLPRHVPENISWREKRSNLIQGNMTLRESRTALVELIARYFELGEVTITPE